MKIVLARGKHFSRESPIPFFSLSVTSAKFIRFHFCCIIVIYVYTFEAIQKWKLLLTIKIPPLNGVHKVKLQGSKAQELAWQECMSELGWTASYLWGLGRSHFLSTGSPHHRSNEPLRTRGFPAGRGAWKRGGPPRTAPGSSEAMSYSAVMEANGWGHPAAYYPQGQHDSLDGDRLPVTTRWLFLATG